MDTSKETTRITFYVKDDKLTFSEYAPKLFRIRTGYTGMWYSFQSSLYYLNYNKNKMGRTTIFWAENLFSRENRRAMICWYCFGRFMYKKNIIWLQILCMQLILWIRFEESSFSSNYWDKTLRELSQETINSLKKILLQINARFWLNPTHSTYINKEIRPQCYQFININAHLTNLK